MDTTAHKLLAAAFQPSALLLRTQSRLQYAVLTVEVKNKWSLNVSILNSCWYWSQGKTAVCVIVLNVVGAIAQSFRQLRNYCMKRYDSGMFKKGNIYIYFVHTMKAWRRSRDMAQPILNLGSGWSSVVNFTPRPHYPRGNIGHPLKRLLGGPWSRSGCCGEKSPLPVFEPRFMTENMKIILKETLMV